MKRWRTLIALLGLGLLVVALAHLGGADSIDAAIVMALRDPGDPAHPIGPAWLEQVALNCSALGSHIIVILVGVAACGWCWLKSGRALAAACGVALAGGMLLNAGLKHLVGRPRPPMPLAETLTTFGFPSGHALLAAATWVPLAALLASGEPRLALRRYAIAIGIAVAAIVGLTRIYLGVHYPSDVLAGWIIGLTWARLCWVAVSSRLMRAVQAEEPATSGQAPRA